MARRERGPAGRRRGRTPKGRGRARIALALLAVAVLLTGGLPMTASEPEFPRAPSTSYGAFEGYAAGRAEVAARLNDTALSSSASGALARLEPAAGEMPVPSIEGILEKPPVRAPVHPAVFDRAEGFDPVNQTTLIAFLLGQPLNYWIYTNYTSPLPPVNGSVFRHEVWTRGVMRPTLDIRIENGVPRFIDYEGWEYIDVDGNASTGDALGRDVRARMKPRIEDMNLNFTLVPAFPPQFEPAIIVKGGLTLDVERLPGALEPVPLDVAFLKSFAYRGYDYIWMIEFNFTSAPASMSTKVTADAIKIKGNLPSSPLELIGKILNLTLGGGATFTDLNGPYTVAWNATELEAFIFMAGYGKIVGRSLTERSWLEASLTGAGSRFVPSTAELWLDAPRLNASFNKLRWTANMPCNLGIRFQEEKENTTYVEADIEGMPAYFFLRLDNDTVGGRNVTLLSLSSSTGIQVLDYSEFEYFNRSVTEYRYVHARLTALPTELRLNGTFALGGEPDTDLNNDLGIAFVARFIDNIMVRITSKFYTVARTLRSLPNSLLSLAPSRGWMQMDMPVPGESLGTLEFWQTSGSVLRLNGTYFAFYNDSASLPASRYPLIQMAFSGRFSDVRSFQADFTGDPVISLRRPPGATGGLRVMYIDDPNSMRATIGLSSLPERVSLNATKEKLRYTASSTIAELNYTAANGPQRLNLRLGGIPESFTLTQGPALLAVETAAGSSLGELTLSVSRGAGLYPPAGWNGSYVAARSGPGGGVMALSLRDVSRLSYATAPAGRFDLSLARPQPFGLYLEKNAARPENLSSARVILDPVPATFSANLPAGVSARPQIPNLLNVTSNLTFARMVNSLSDLGEQFIGTMSNLTENIVSVVEGLGSNTTFSFSSGPLANLTPTTMVASLRKGPVAGDLSEESIGWAHGIVGRIRNRQFVLHILLDLPRDGSLTARTSGDTLAASIEMKDWNPSYDYLLLQMEGINGRDIRLFLDGLGRGLTFNMTADVLTNLSMGRSRMEGTVRASASQPIGRLLVNLDRPLSEPPSTVAIYSPSVPQRFSTTFFMADRVEISLDASSEIPYFMAKLSKRVSGSWRSLAAIFHDVPRAFSISVEPPAAFDTDGSLLQNLPTYSVETNHTDTLDLWVSVEGAATGGRQNYELDFRDIGDSSHGGFDSETGVYSIRSSRIGSLLLRVHSVPYNRNLMIDSMALFVENGESVDISAGSLFGTFPVFETAGEKFSSFQMALEGRLFMGGRWHPAKLYLVDFDTDGAPSMHISRNGAALGRSEGGGRRTIMMAPIATLLSSMLG